MRLSRKWAKIGRILFYTGTAGWIITAVLQLVYLNAAARAYPPIPEPVWIDVLWIGFFVWMDIGLWIRLWHCRCPHCGAWNVRVPSPWKRGEVLHCPRCGNRLEYDDT